MMREKIKKFNENADANRRTSLDDLPNVILVNILSMLPAKDAVKTSVLSKRWEYLWTYVSVLKFDEGQFSGKPVFMNFVDKVLLLHDQSSLKEFYLSCDPFPYTYRIDTWISTAIRRNVEVLKLCLKDSQLSSKYMLPHCIFNSQSLKTFHLDMQCGLKLPSHICLPSLEELNLSHVEFIDDGSTHSLLSGPALKRLSFSQCEWDISSGSIDAPKLQSLSIDESEECEDPEYMYSEDEIAIVSPSLKFFSYVGSFTTEFGIHGSPQLVEAKICSTFSDDDRPQTERLVVLLKGLVCVKALTLSSDCLEMLRNRFFGPLPEFSIGSLPEFGNLTNLDMDVSNIYWDDGPFLQILEKCPYLTTLNLNENRGCHHNPKKSRDCHKDSGYLMPSCFGSHLKKITIRNFDLMWSDLTFISILLKTAKVLEEMVIYRHFDKKKKIKIDKEDLKNEILKSLKEVPKGSKLCKISVI